MSGETMKRSQRHRTMKQTQPPQRAAAPPPAGPSVDTLFAEAVRHHQAGRLADAGRLYRQILALLPNHFAVLNNLGLMSPPHEAAMLYRQALAVQPDYADAHINLGGVLRAEGKLDDAIVHFRRALALNPDHAGVHFVLGSILQEQGKFEEAMASYRRTLTLKPDHAEAHINVGTVFQATGRTDEAIAQFRRALFLQPNHAGVHFVLGTLLQERGDLDEAVASYRRALALKPDHVESLNNLGIALHAQRKTDEAVALHQRALALNPTSAEAHNNLGDVFKEQGRLDDAVASYLRALACKPDFAIALCNLGTTYAIASQFEPAAEWYRRALAIDPDQGVANMNLASILESGGRLAEAQLYRRRAPRPQPLIVEPAPEPRRNVLILTAAGDGNVPVETLVPKQVNSRVKWNVECATDGQEDALPPYDVVFNVIGNADLIGPSLPRMTRFLGRCRRPVLNPPERIPPTRRDRMPALFADIPNVVVPPVTRLLREEAAAPGLAARLAAAGLTYPLLMRPISGQGGTGIVLVDTPDQLAGLTFSDADAFYFISYRDYRSADGYFRKYRTIFVDRQPHPYHLAISPRWLVHYFSAEMLAEPWKREEERRFLENPAEALGPVVAEAIAAIGRRMDMDYCGIDFSVLPDGRVLVFEANATMSVILPDAVDFPYKPAYVRRIYASFEAMLERRATAPDRVPG